MKMKYIVLEFLCLVAGLNPKPSLFQHVAADYCKLSGISLTTVQLMRGKNVKPSKAVAPKTSLVEVPEADTAFRLKKTMNNKK